MPNKNQELEPVNDIKMVQRYLLYGLEFREVLSCLIEDNEIQFEALILSVDATTLALEIEITEEGFARLDSNKLAAIDRQRGPIRLSYSVSEATFFVHSTFQGRSNRRIQLKADLPIFKLQRREALRIKVIESHKATIRINATVYALFDISAGGVSIIIPLAQERLFQKQQSFPKCTMTFLGKSCEVNLEVKNVLAHGKDGQKVKVGFRFKGLHASVEQLIAREAYLHTHKIWSRWL